MRVVGLVLPTTPQSEGVMVSSLACQPVSLSIPWGGCIDSHWTELLFTRVHHPVSGTTQSLAERLRAFPSSAAHIVFLQRSTIGDQTHEIKMPPKINAINTQRRSTKMFLGCTSVCPVQVSHRGGNRFPVYLSHPKIFCREIFIRRKVICLEMK